MGYSIFDETMVAMTWPEIEQAVARGAIVLLPIGIIEEHGPHMGLAVDTYAACLVCQRAKLALEARGIITLIAPPSYWGISPGTSTFPGTFSVRKETMKAVIGDILTSLHGWGLRQVFAINWHADRDHIAALLEAVKEARRSGLGAYCLLHDYDVRRCRLTGGEDYIIVRQTPPPQGPPPPYVDLHAGSLETGIMMRYFPEQVDGEMARTLKRTELTYQDLRVLGGGDSGAIRRLIPGGYFGDPAGYDVAAAEKFIESYAQDTANLIESFLKGTYRPPVG